MPRIKVFTANLGFYETAVAARSQKMALAHWGVTRDLFREGSAKESNDPRAIEAAMQKVGLVYRRPIGSPGPFEERTDAKEALLKRVGTNLPKRPKRKGSRNKALQPSEQKHRATKRARR